MEAFDWTIVFGLLAVVALVFANGFFVASEFGLVALRRSRIEQLNMSGHRLGPNLTRASDNLDAYLAATQLGITLSSLGLGWIGEPAVAAVIEPAFRGLPPPLDSIGAHTVAVVIAFSLITFLHIVFGELIPKSLALQRAEKVSLAIVQPLTFFLVLLKPAIFVLNGFGNWLLRKGGLNPASGESHLHSPEELKLLIHSASLAGLIDEVQESLVDRAFTLGVRPIAACMTPRQDIAWVNVEMPFAAIRRKVLESPHVLFPVRRGADDALGTVSAKRVLASDPSHPILPEELIEPAVFVQETANALVVLQQMRRDGTELALVVDEYGDLQGLVTLMDIFDALAGESGLQSPAAQGDALDLDATRERIFDGGVSIDDFRRDLQRPKLGIEDDLTYHSAAGFVLHRLQHIPIVGTRFVYDGLEFEVKEMTRQRITRIGVRPASLQKS